MQSFSRWRLLSIVKVLGNKANLPINKPHDLPPIEQLIFWKPSMNFISSNSTSGYRLGARSGLSIIEVLTSVVVAMIGVFGVLALIPFAVKQASLGLDSDAAVTTARNAISQMEITGMQFPSELGKLNRRL